MTDASLEFGHDQVILDRYKVIKLLGRGGMGSVYEVEHTHLHAHYALKFLNKNQTNDAAWRRFEIEARATNKLEHPNLIKVHDFGLLPDGQPFFIMDLVEGDTLADILKKRGRLSVEQTLKIFIQVGFALSYAHSNGIVHRDVKPSNIIVTSSSSGKTEDSLVKLVDFGIAKLTGQDGFNQQTLTRTGEIFGSPLYMSPEQCLGIGVDHRTDLYSLGCVMFEALTGAPPLVGDNALSTMMKHQSEAPLSLKEASMGIEFPKRIEQVVERLLAKDLQSRYQSAQLLTADLVGLDTAQILTTALTPLSAPKVDSRGAALGKGSMWIIGGCILLLGFTCGYFYNGYRLAPFDNLSNSVRGPGKLPTVSELTDITSPAEGSKIKQDLEAAFAAEAAKTAFFSKPGPADGRTFTFPKLLIGDYEAPHAQKKTNPFVVPKFQGIYFRPNLDFRRHPQLFLRFRPDDIHTLNLSQTRTYANLLTDNLSDVDEVFPYLTHLKSIVSLSAADSEITTKGMSCINQLPNLMVLRLERSKLTGETLTRLSRLPRLETLCIHTVKDNEELVKILAQSKSMRILRLIDCDLTPSQVAQLAKIPTLIEIDLSRNPKVTDDCIKLLPRKLECLGLIGCSISEKSINEFGRLKSLRHLILDEKKWSGIDIQKLHLLLPRTQIQLGLIRRKSEKPDYIQD